MGGGYTKKIDDNFPMMSKECKKETVSFFQCFEQEGRPSEERPDPLAGERALLKCQQEHEAYRNCLNRVLTARAQK